ncbi:unnamed protein product [Rotaria sordida]|uniref:Uncharacterized protein n=1 Tax=Rotaria sordida TaxID=392033 RepID=A0A815RXK4_9BILA|nr:unnamed protein product [Rotaria sordida]CAF1648537.1 unnamed protein product [Rotaria sordida]
MNDLKLKLNTQIFNSIVTAIILICIVRSAPRSSSTDRSLILPDYYNEDENDLFDAEIIDKTTTQGSTKDRKMLSSLIPWLEQRMSTTRTTTMIDDETDDEYEAEGYLQNARQFLKKIWDSLSKLLKNITVYDIVKAIQQYFKRKAEE